MGLLTGLSPRQEYGRSIRRHSSFWIGLYGQCWVIGMEFVSEIVIELMRVRRNKLPFFQRGMQGKRILTGTQNMLQLNPTKFPCILLYFMDAINGKRF